MPLMKACWRYSSAPVKDGELEQVLEAARWSQSAKNLQDWRFIVVRDSSSKKRLAEAAKGQSFVAEAPVVIVCCGIDTGYVMTCGQASYPIDAAIAMELGCDGVLMNTAIAAAQNPVLMASAMKQGVAAGRAAYLAGRMPKKLYSASPSSPTSGMISKS